MSKHTKLSIGSERTAETDSITVDGLHARMIIVLDTMLTAVEDTLRTGEATPQLMRETLPLTKMVAAMKTEQRQDQKAAQKRIESITPQMIVSYMRQAQPDQRANLLSELNSIGEKSVLS